jgi:hypothetical protein
VISRSADAALPPSVPVTAWNSPGVSATAFSLQGRSDQSPAWSAAGRGSRLKLAAGKAHASRGSDLARLAVRRPLSSGTGLATRFFSLAS